MPFIIKLILLTIYKLFYSSLDKTTYNQYIKNDIVQLKNISVKNFLKTSIQENTIDFCFYCV
jgi:hypothetical protein